jgi:hypothetical protein
MATGGSNLHTDDLFGEEGRLAMCQLLYLAQFCNHREELRNALAASKSKVRDLEISLREVDAGGRELKRVTKEATDSE